MFEVQVSYILDDLWEERDQLIYEAARRRSDWSTAGSDGINPSSREHGWFVSTFDEAIALKGRLALVAKITVTFREQTSIYVK